MNTSAEFLHIDDLIKKVAIDLTPREVDILTEIQDFFADKIANSDDKYAVFKYTQRAKDEVDEDDPPAFRPVFIRFIESRGYSVDYHRKRDEMFRTYVVLSVGARTHLCRT